MIPRSSLQRSLRVSLCARKSRDLTTRAVNKPTLGVFTGNSQCGLACLKALVPRAKDYNIVAIVRSDNKAQVLKRKLGEEDFAKIHVVSNVDARDKAAMQRAYEGMDRLMVVTPHVEERGPLARAMVQTARESGITSLVLLSSWTSAFPHPLFQDHFKLTEDLAKQLFPHCVTVLRAGYFMSNLLGQARAIATQDVIRLPFSETTKFALVDPSDIGATAAASLVTSCRFDPHTVDVTGPKAYSPPEIARAFSEVLGRDIKVECVTPEQSYKAMLSAGLSEWAAAFAKVLLGLKFIFDFALCVCVCVKANFSRM